MLQKLSAKRKIDFQKKNVEMGSLKTTDWSFIRHEKGETLCGKQVGLKEFASYTSFFEQQNFSHLAENKNE